jgi:hypothetical protein
MLVLFETELALTTNVPIASQQTTVPSQGDRFNLTICVVGITMEMASPLCVHFVHVTLNNLAWELHEAPWLLLRTFLLVLFSQWNCSIRLNMKSKNCNWYSSVSVGTGYELDSKQMLWLFYMPHLIIVTCCLHLQDEGKRGALNMKATCFSETFVPVYNIYSLLMLKQVSTYAGCAI